MFDRDRWIEIFEVIKKNKLRTFLSGFTVAIGIFIFTVLSGMGDGLNNTFSGSFADYANIIRIYGGFTSKPYKGLPINRRVQFKNDDLEFIKKNYSDKIQYYTAKLPVVGNVRYKNQWGNYGIEAVNPQNQILDKNDLIKGRYINQRDLDKRRKTAVIGRLVEKDLFKNKNSLGKHLDINEFSYKVVGVFKDDKGDDRKERNIYLPLRTAQLIYQKEGDIGSILLAHNKNMSYDQVNAFSKRLERDLKVRHFVAPKDISAIRVWSMADAIKNTTSFLVVIKLITLLISIGTLIAGIVGISNIMVFSIKERTKELGIRKALGAKPKSIIALVLQEAILITALAGYGGMLLGIIAVRAISDNLEKEYFIKNPEIDIITVIFATIILIIAGVIAGYLPAKRAARIKPIIALRDK